MEKEILNNRTKGKWYIPENSAMKGLRIMCEDKVQKTHIADCFSIASGIPQHIAEANAAYIVEACNSYEMLKVEREELHNFLSLLIGSASLERIERFDLLEKAKELFHKSSK